MAFTITLYNCTNDPRSLDKTLENGVETSNVRPTGIVDLLNPTFELDYSAALATKNYCVAGAPFNRSYFITDMKIDIGKKIIISCAVDVLQTYKEGINNINANVIRQENLTEPYLPDSEYKVRSGFQNYSYAWYEQTGNFVFLQTPVYVLNVMGGEHSNQYLLLPDAQTPPTDWSTNWASYYILEDGNYISVGTLYGFSTAPPYDVVYIAHNGVYQRIW